MRCLRDDGALAVFSGASASLDSAVDAAGSDFPGARRIGTAQRKPRPKVADPNSAQCSTDVPRAIGTPVPLAFVRPFIGNPNESLRQRLA